MKKAFKNSILFASMFALFAVNVAHAQMPNVTSAYATPSTNTAMLYATVNASGYPATAWFEYSTDSNMYNVYETIHTFIGTNSYTKSISANIYNLSPNTVYYFRAVIDNTRGTAKSNIASFLTNYQQTNTYQNQQVSTNTNYVINETRYVDRIVPVTVHTQETTVNTSNFNNQNVNGVTFQTPSTNLVTNTVDKNVNVASPLFGSGFLPNTTWEWIIVIAIILLIVIVMRKIVN